MTTPGDIFRRTAELMALRRVYRALRRVLFDDEERAAVDACFRDHETWLVIVLQDLLRASTPALLAVVNARLACGSPPIRPPAVDATHEAALEALRPPCQDVLADVDWPADVPPDRVH